MGGVGLLLWLACGLERATGLWLLLALLFAGQSTLSLLAVVILSLSDRHKPVFVPIRDSACFAGEPNVLYPEIRSS